MNFVKKRKTQLLILLLIILLGVLLAVAPFYKQYRYRRNLEKSLLLMGDWFIKNQKEQGDFYYQRNVADGKETDRNHITRQAGSVYALSLLYKYTGDPTIKEVLKKNFYYFKGQSHPGTLTTADKQYSTFKIVYRDNPVNNPNALILLALINYIDKDPAERYKYALFADGLAAQVLSSQQPSGGFMYKLDPTEEDDFNNGESFYALSRYFQYSQNRTYREAAKKAADYFLQKYSSDNLNMSFFGWGLQGYYYLYQEVPDEKYWTYMRKSIDTYMKNTATNQMDFYHNYGSIPPPPSLAVPLEGINHIAKLAENRDPDFFRQIKIYLDQSMLYLQQFQINGPLSRRKSEHQKVQGGICIDYYCQIEQIDVTGHNLASLYFYLTFFK